MVDPGRMKRILFCQAPSRPTAADAVAKSTTCSRSVAGIRCTSETLAQSARSGCKRSWAPMRLRRHASARVYTSIRHDCTPARRFASACISAARRSVGATAKSGARPLGRSATVRGMTSGLFVHLSSPTAIGSTVQRCCTASIETSSMPQPAHPLGLS
eukprot:2111695-Prymnesium_polylepis.1